MGFFQSLKEDLSTAMNELINDENVYLNDKDDYDNEDELVLSEDEQLYPDGEELLSNDVPESLAEELDGDMNISDDELESQELSVEEYDASYDNDDSYEDVTSYDEEALTVGAEDSNESIEQMDDMLSFLNEIASDNESLEENQEEESELTLEDIDIDSMLDNLNLGEAITGSDDNVEDNVDENTDENADVNTIADSEDAFNKLMEAASLTADADLEADQTSIEDILAGLAMNDIEEQASEETTEVSAEDDAEETFAEVTATEEIVADGTVVDEVVEDDFAVEGASVAVEEPVVEEIPVVKEVSAVEEIPVAEEVQAVEEISVEEVQAVEEISVEEVPVVEEMPVIEEPVVDEIPVAEEPILEETPAAMEPVVEETPAAVEPVVEAAPEVKAPERIIIPDEINLDYSDETAVITKGMKILGNVQSNGNMNVYGSITGNINIVGKLNVSGIINGDATAHEIFADGAQISGNINVSGTAKFGESTVVIGNITAAGAVIAGAVKGDIDVQGPVILDSSAIVMGNIKSMSVQINNGAIVEGLCSQCYAQVNPSSFFEEFKKASKKFK